MVLVTTSEECTETAEGEEGGQGRRSLALCSALGLLPGLALAAAFYK